jgi:hypothetical protein
MLKLSLEELENIINDSWNNQKELKSNCANFTRAR